MSISENLKPLVREWYKIKQDLNFLKEQENKLRGEVISSIFGEEDTKGTKRDDIGNGMDIVLSRSAKISIDKEAFDRHKVIMEKKGLIGDDSVIKYEPKVSATAFKYMSDGDKAEFAEVFVHGFNSPQLEIKARKD